MVHLCFLIGRKQGENYNVILRKRGYLFTGISGIDAKPRWRSASLGI